jgi:hypothetical protein
MADYFEYEIDGKKYIQRRLVLAQVKQISKLFNNLSLPADGNMLGIVTALGDKLGTALAIVLIPADTPLGTPEAIRNALQKKDLDKLELDMNYAVDTDMQALAVKVVEDFLECNPLSLTFEGMGGIADRIVGKSKGKADSVSKKAVKKKKTG